MTLAALAGHDFPRAIDTPPDAPWRCRCGLTLTRAELHDRQAPCPLAGIPNTVEQMSTRLNPEREAPAALDEQLSLLDLASPVA